MQMCKCANVWMCRCADAWMCKCANVQMQASDLSPDDRTPAEVKQDDDNKSKNAKQKKIGVTGNKQIKVHALYFQG